MFQDNQFLQKHGHSPEARAMQKTGLASSLGAPSPGGDRSSVYSPWGNRLLGNPRKTPLNEPSPTRF